MSSIEQQSARREMFHTSSDGRYSLANQVFAEGKVKGYPLGQRRARIDVQWVLERASVRLYKVYQRYQPTLLPGVVLSSSAWGCLPRRGIGNVWAMRGI